MSLNKLKSKTKKHFLNLQILNPNNNNKKLIRLKPKNAIIAETKIISKPILYMVLVIFLKSEGV